MAITTLAQLHTAISKGIDIYFEKATLANAVAGETFSLWRATGNPGAGALPTATPSVCDETTSGRIVVPDGTTTIKRYIGEAEYVPPTQYNSVQVFDRLVHMGSLNSTVVTTQNVGIDLQTLGATANINQRKGDANYSDVQWWIEIYGDLGATNASATVNVTYSDGSTGNLAALILPRRAGRWLSLNQYMPIGLTSNLFIRGVNTITLNTSTGTAGNFGVTASRYRCNIGGGYTDTYASPKTVSWDLLGVPEIFERSCLMLATTASATSTSLQRGSIKFISG